MPVQYTVNLDRDIITRHDNLAGNFCDLHLDIDTMHVFCERVDLEGKANEPLLFSSTCNGIYLNQTRVNAFVKLAKLCDQANIALIHLFEGIRATNAAWDLGTV